MPYSGKRWISSSSFANWMISSLRAMGVIIATLCALGVWRSLVARSVRVGEVRSSNLRTPMSVGDARFPTFFTGEDERSAEAEQWREDDHDRGGPQGEDG